MTIQELLENSCKLVDIDSSCEVIVYDQNIQDVSSLSSDDFLAVLLSKLCEIFKSVFVLEGKSAIIEGSKVSIKQYIKILLYQYQLLLASL